MRFDRNIGFLLSANLAHLYIARVLSTDSGGLLSLLLALLAIAAGILILISSKIIMLPSGRVIGQVAPVFLIRRFPGLR